MNVICNYCFLIDFLFTLHRNRTTHTKEEEKKELRNGKLVKTGLKAKKWFLLVTDVLVLPLLFFPRI